MACCISGQVSTGRPKLRVTARLLRVCGATANGKQRIPRSSACVLACADHGDKLSDFFDRQGYEFCHGRDTAFVQFGDGSPAKTPDVAEINISVGEVADAGPVAIPLGYLVRELGDGLSGADADAGRDLGDAAHLVADSGGVGFAVGGEAGKIQKHLVDGIGLDPRKPREKARPSPKPRACHSGRRGQNRRFDLSKTAP
jgi:hypothetical protein